MTRQRSFRVYPAPLKGAGHPRTQVFKTSSSHAKNVEHRATKCVTDSPGPDQHLLQPSLNCTVWGTHSTIFLIRN